MGTGRSTCPRPGIPPGRDSGLWSRDIRGGDAHTVPPLGGRRREHLMGMSRWQTAGAVGCLVVGPLGQLAQYLVTPVNEGASPSEQVTAAAGHGSAMGVAVVLDVLLLLIMPAVLYAGVV